MIMPNCPMHQVLFCWLVIRNKERFARIANRRSYRRNRCKKKKVKRRCIQFKKLKKRFLFLMSLLLCQRSLRFLFFFPIFRVLKRERVWVVGDLNNFYWIYWNRRRPEERRKEKRRRWRERLNKERLSNRRKERRRKIKRFRRWIS